MENIFHETHAKMTDVNDGSREILVTTKLRVNLTETDILDYIANCQDPVAMKRIATRANLRHIHLLENSEDTLDRE